MNAVQSRMMGQAIAERMYTSYLQVNDRQLAQKVAKNVGESQAMEKSRDVQPAKGLQPTQTLAKVDLRTKVLSFEQSDFLKNYRNSMLDLQSMAAELLSGGAEVTQTLAAGSDAPGVAEAVVKALCDKNGLDAEALKSFDAAGYKEAQYDKLAAAVRGSLDMELVYRILNREV